MSELDFGKIKKGDKIRATGEQWEGLKTFEVHGVDDKFQCVDVHEKIGGWVIYAIQFDDVVSIEGR